MYMNCLETGGPRQRLIADYKIRGHARSATADAVAAINSGDMVSPLIPDTGGADMTAAVKSRRLRECFVAKACPSQLTVRECSPFQTQRTNMTNTGPANSERHLM